MAVANTPASPDTNQDKRSGNIHCTEMYVRSQQVCTSEILKRVLGSLTKYEIICWI